MTQKLFTKNFTLLVLGQASSLFGNFILKFALSMYILDVTGSATIFAGILAVATIPTIILSPLGGILADRANRRNIMVILDLLTGVSVLSATLLLSLFNDLTVISVLLIILSILGAFETPTVQACVPQMQTGDNIIKGNAVVTQVASVAFLIAPILGSMLYSTFGLKTVMVVSIICFFLTSIFECFIKLEYTPHGNQEGILNIIKSDFSVSIKFLCKEQPIILKLLLLASIVNFFVIGISLIGTPYIIRNILGLSVEYYGFAQSILGFCAILGSIMAGLLIGKLKIGKLSHLLTATGAFLLPVGIAFIFPTSVITKYVLNIIAICGMQIASCVFSVFAFSMIQQKTPNHLIGKVMSYIVTISLCMQPIGQMIYGLMFDKFSNSVYIILIPTGVILCLIGIISTKFFKNLEQKN